jgi:hypothetical protein
VTDASSNPIADVMVSVGPSGSTATGANGAYIIAGLITGTYTLVPDTVGYFWSPTGHTIAIPPDATDQDFTGRNVQTQVTPLAPFAAEYGDVLTYTVHLVYPETASLLFRDPVPTYTTYISGSLSAPTGLFYDREANAISGTLVVTAGQVQAVAFAVRVGITGTLGFAPIIVNQGCVYTLVGEPVDCDEAFSFAYIWPVYLPLVQRSY